VSWYKTSSSAHNDSLLDRPTPCPESPTEDLTVQCTPPAQSQQPDVGTERVTDAELVDLVGLSQEIAERLPNNSDRGHWDLEMSKVFGSAMFSTLYNVETQYFHEQYGDAEFAEQLQRAGTLGAVLHIRCLDGLRQDHYVPVVPRGNNDGYSIDDSQPSSPSRQLVDAHQIEVTGNLENGFLVTKLFGWPVERKFLTCCKGLNVVALQSIPASREATALLPTLRATDGRQILGVAFIERPRSALPRVESQHPVESLPRALTEPTPSVMPLAPVPQQPTATAPAESLDDVMEKVLGDGGTQAHLLKGKTRMQKDWMVNADGEPLCFGNNKRPWKMPDLCNLTFPWMEPDTDSYYDKDTGQLRNLLWSDIDADRSAEKSKPRATQPLVLRFFGSMREIKSAGEETVDKVKGIRAAGVLVCAIFGARMATWLQTR
jgi:hypothetical protein